MKPLPPIFAVQGAGDRWLAISPSGRPHDRRFDRQELRAIDSGSDRAVLAANGSVANGRVPYLPPTLLKSQ
jgi:hypothetical protein